MEADERLVFLRTESAFLQYAAVYGNSFIKPRLALAQRANLAHHVQHLCHLSSLASRNAEMLSCFGDSVKLFVGEGDTDLVVEPSQLDESKVASTLRQLAREWSSDGINERRQSIDRIVETVCKYFPVSVRSTTKVIVPGSGLGRLPFELSCKGFDAIGNEFSTHMLLASHAILNRSWKEKAWVIYPYIHTASHWRSNVDQYREVRVPDVWPGELSQSGSMSMAVGGFEELAASPESRGCMQCVATCFFIDAPYNFLNTLEAISQIVELGGVWVNFGPLHWHSEDLSVDGLEFSLESTLKLVEEFGWEIIERESQVPATYCATHPNRMARMVFDCEFWVARKIRPL